MGKKCISLLAVVLFSLVLQAHEFWMQPDKYTYAIGEMAQINFMVGENFVGERWNTSAHRLLRLDHYAGDNQEELLNKVNTGAGRNLEVRLVQRGTHLFVLQSNNAFSELEAEKFNDYLKEDGLDEVYDHRKNTNTLDKPAKEYYSRCAKLLLQSGIAPDETYSRVAGLPLEIIPLQNPYRLKQGDEMSFKVLYEGKPLPFALVKVWNRKNNNTILQDIYTQKDGIITTRLGNTGSWMISSVKMVPSKEEGAEWQSYWASLVFGF